MTTGIQFADPNIKDLAKMTKKELIEFIYKQVRLYRIVSEGAIDFAQKSEYLEKENEKLNLRLAKAVSHVEQGRSMIESVMERWYEYDD